MTTLTVSDSTTLYYKSGSSDKVYQVSVEPSGPGFAVNFAYGRRGSTLQTGTKTASPIGYSEAKNIMLRLVNEKMAKGYTPGESGTPYQHSDKEERATGILPQLLNDMDKSDLVRLIEDDNWWAQEKFDGRRVLIRKDHNHITGINRQGLAIDLPAPIVEA